MAMTGLVDVAAARVTRDPDGAVEVDDPGSPWLVRVWVHDASGRAAISRLDIQARHPHAGGVTAARLGRLPTAQLLQVAAAEALGAGHADEVYYRMLAAPRPAHVRSWDADHWPRVLAVHDWAVASGRAGGGARAVADLWGVSVNPTVYRWLAEARRRASTVAA